MAPTMGEDAPDMELESAVSGHIDVAVEADQVTDVTEATYIVRHVVPVAKAEAYQEWVERYQTAARAESAGGCKGRSELILSENESFTTRIIIITFRDYASLQRMIAGMVPGSERYTLMEEAIEAGILENGRELLDGIANGESFVGQDGYIKMDRHNIIEPPKLVYHGIPKWKSMLMIFILIVPTNYMLAQLYFQKNLQNWIYDKFGTQNSNLCSYQKVAQPGGGPPCQMGPNASFDRGNLIGNSFLNTFILSWGILLPMINFAFLPCLMMIGPLRRWFLSPRNPDNWIPVGRSCVECLDQGLPCFYRAPIRLPEVERLEGVVAGLREVSSRHEDALASQSTPLMSEAEQEAEEARNEARAARSLKVAEAAQATSGDDFQQVTNSIHLWVKWEYVLSFTKKFEAFQHDVVRHMPGSKGVSVLWLSETEVVMVTNWDSIESLQDFLASAQRKEFQQSFMHMVETANAEFEAYPDVFGTILALPAPPGGGPPPRPGLWKNWIALGVPLFMSLWVTLDYNATYWVCVWNIRSNIVLNMVSTLLVQMPIMSFFFGPAMGFLFRDFIERPWPEWADHPWWGLLYRPWPNPGPNAKYQMLIAVCMTLAWWIAMFSIYYGGTYQHNTDHINDQVYLHLYNCNPDSLSNPSPPPPPGRGRL